MFSAQALTKYLFWKGMYKNIFKELIVQKIYKQTTNHVFNIHAMGRICKDVKLCTFRTDFDGLKIVTREALVQKCLHKGERR